MITIYKYDLQVQDHQEVEMHKAARLLSVAVQNGEIKIWAIVDTQQPLEKRKIRLAGTGHDITDDLVAFIGTIQLHGGSLVFHVFEKL